MWRYPIRVIITASLNTSSEIGNEDNKEHRDSGKNTKQYGVRSQAKGNNFKQSGLQMKSLKECYKQYTATGTDQKHCH